MQSGQQISGRFSRNLKRAGLRLFAVWIAVGLIAGIFIARSTHRDYRGSFSDDYMVRFYLPEADPENGPSFWYNPDAENLKNVPVSWTNVRNLHCFRDVVGDNFVKKYSFEDSSVAGGYIFIINPDIKFWAYSPKPSPTEKARKACIEKAEQDHARSWVGTFWSRYKRKFLELYLVGSAAVVISIGAITWIISGLRSK